MKLYSKISSAAKIAHNTARAAHTPDNKTTVRPAVLSLKSIMLPELLHKIFDRGIALGSELKLTAQL